jgi:queuine/archaeosine tRNA-ribosyltransferase
MQEIREAIQGNIFSDFKKDFLSQYKTTDESIRIAQKQKWLNAQRGNRD